ncbi:MULTISPECIES: aldehyde dehydrogenase [unclassified Bacillus (in: firmicutes)]|uniref:aldehyde dehydrogenase n=1 Tax=unclassified Bacillus (in: firmicutes) TaxID=185979 RepID=UPI0008EAFDD1|nr:MULTISPECIES: aldehyde dehydrogenase [unclassified Bacillus (in: firmicutes)]SFA81422.1 aldehyde dehydrogenase (NAD+) [Bacillus sp. UNCCL13]SFQ71498.1 aldehyde dehydrogenase (NAD+) [Bacillus sp. cl95]
MVELDMKKILQEHKQFFHNGHTKTLEFRLEQLQKLKDAIIRYEKEIITALNKDLRKSEFEAYGTEIGFTLDSLRYMLKNLKHWMKPEKVKTPLHQFPAKSYIMKEPYGTVLIIGPFNYPFQLIIEPLIGAIAAGNCVVLKPSESTPHVSALIKKMMRETFDEHYVRVMEGEKETTSLLIHAPFDYIFFTGSVPVGKIVMEAAAKNLVPITLELGGKSPVIVDETANLEIAAKRIMWGKMINAGQTCIAPDYVIAHAKIKDALIDKMKEAVTSFYGTDASKSEDYGRIVNERQFDRLAEIIEKDRRKVVFGGNVLREDLYIQPTIFDKITWDDASMMNENFGPILPVLEFNHLEEAINMINDRPKPLALYIFTENKRVEDEVLSKVSFGGGCVNDTLSHVASAHLPFGGVGNSGIGAYHGKHSFEVFSHSKSILKKSTKFELGIVFPPYKDKIKLAKKLLK